MSRKRGEVLTDKFVGLLADGNLFCFCAGIFRVWIVYMFKGWPLGLAWALWG